MAAPTHGLPSDRTLAGAALFRLSRASGDFQSHTNLLAFSQQLFSVFGSEGEKFLPLSSPIPEHILDS